MTTQGDQQPSEDHSISRDPSAIVRVTTHPVAQFILGTMPWTGGVGSLLSQRAADRQGERLLAFLRDLASDLDVALDHARAEEVIQDEVSLDDLLARTQFALEEFASNSDGQKVNFLRRFVIAGCLPRAPDATRMSLFRAYVRSLTGMHLAVLQVFYERQGLFPEVERLGRVERDPNLPTSIDEIALRFSEAEKIVPIVLNDLTSRGFLVDWTASGNSGTPRSRFAITNIGVELLAYLKYEWADSPRQN